MDVQGMKQSEDFAIRNDEGLQADTPNGFAAFGIETRITRRPGDVVLFAGCVLLFRSLATGMEPVTPVVYLSGQYGTEPHQT